MKIFSIVLLAFFIFSCSSDDPAPLTIPQCIDDEISVFASQACVGSGDLTKWTLNGEDVYCFNQGTCISDGQALIYNESCTLICTLGGIAGNTICDGVVWNGNATLQGVVYRY